MDQPETYQCAICKQTFSKPNDENWNREKALAELKREFGDVPVEKCSVVCNECYKIVMRVRSMLG